MRYDPRDTVAAIASAPGGAARAIVRLSGPQTIAILRGCLLSPETLPQKKSFQPLALHTSLKWSADQPAIPGTLFLWPARGSYTRQQLAEWHMLGSPPLVQAALRTVCQHGARLAEPGEFTLRAFLAGRIDLTQAEAVLGVIDAQGTAELETALTQLAGGLRGPLNELREQLLNLLAHLEAGLDFVEEDIEFISVAELTGHLQTIHVQVTALARQAGQRMQVHDAVRVVLLGQPNAGKSSLFNALNGTAAATPALVSAVPGTTRDYLTATVDLAGVPITLIDTAGYDPAAAGPGAQAELQRQAQVAQAQVLLICLDGSVARTMWEEALLAAPSALPRVVALTKCDLPTLAPLPDSIPTSIATTTGLDALRAALRTAALTTRGEGTWVAATATRCAESLRGAEQALQTALTLTANRSGDELIAAELRHALLELGQVVGAVHTDDLLDRIFSRFCIGK